MVLLASGTGFAPIKAIIEHLIEKGSQRKAILYWGCRSQRRPLPERLGRGSHGRRLAHLRYVPVLSEPKPEDAWTGRTGLVHQAVMHDLPNLLEHQVYACGVPIMVESAQRDFIARCGLPDDEFYADRVHLGGRQARPARMNRPDEATATQSPRLPPAPPPRPCRSRAGASPAAALRSCPYPPGGPLDIVARSLAERVKDSLGVVIVENRPGAGGNLGADAVAKAPPDGTHDRDGRGGDARDQPLAVREAPLRPDPRLHADHAASRRCPTCW